MQFLETCNGIDIFRLKNVVKNVPQLENAHFGTTWKCSGNQTRFIDRVHRGSWLSIRDVMFVKKQFTACCGSARPGQREIWFFRSYSTW